MAGVPVRWVMAAASASACVLRQICEVFAARAMR
jgi:hypothetical protein